MPKSFFLIICCLILNLCFAQQSKDVDSLRNIINRDRAEDSNRVKTLLNLAFSIIYDKPDSSMIYTDEAVRTTFKIKWQKGIALSYRQKGYVYYILSDYTHSMDYYLKALKAGEKLGNKYFDATIFNNVANIYADLKNYKEALDYYEKYLVISRTIKSKNDEMGALVNIGNIYTELNDLTLGLDYFNKALSIAEETGNKRISTAVLNNIGEIFLKQKNYSNALAYFQRSILLADKSDYRNIKASALNGIGEVFLNQGDFANAENYSRESFELARELKDLSWQVNALETLSKIHEKQKKYDEALKDYRQSVVLRDSSVNEDKKAEVTRLAMQYDFDKKEALTKATNDKQHALAVAEINRQKVIRNASIIIGGILILAAIAGIIIYKRRKDNIEKKKEAEFNVQVADTEMKALRAQMNPHFIYNSLNSINDYIDKHDIDKATDYTTKFAKLMRMILENSEHKEIPLADDLKTLELYMQLENMRMNNKFSYEIKVDDNIDPDNTLIPPLILQPFVENSIWHGIAGKNDNGKIWIHIKKEGNMINCVVEDNGVGIRQSAHSEKETSGTSKKSLGMKITNERIDILNKLKRSNAAVTLSSLSGGTKIEVKLPEELTF